MTDFFPFSAVFLCDCMKMYAYNCEIVCQFYIYTVCERERGRGELRTMAKLLHEN